MCSVQDLYTMTLVIAEYCSIVINEDLEIVSFSHRRELAARRRRFLYH